MPIKKELLDILACPVCKVAVTLTADGKGLKCGKCERIYPILEGDIPYMIADDNRVDS